MKLLSKLKTLKPREFEQLVFDLLMLRGLGNLQWRTPGSDAGRDIEGEFDARDFSGASRAEHWYVECKRHSGTVDWPTVYGKLAYADSHGADYLLICTTGSLSPQCKDEMSRHERSRKRPKLRAWEGAYLETAIADEAILLLKFGLSHSKRNRELSALPLADILAKTVHQAYGENTAPSAALEFGAASAELVSMRLSVARTTHESRSFDRERDGYSWLRVKGTPLRTNWGSHECRMLVTGLRFVTKSSVIELEYVAKAGGTSLRVSPAPRPDSSVGRDLLNALSVLANWEWRVNNRLVEISSRKQD